MSNVTVVLFVLSILGAGACIFALTLFKENKALKAKLALSQENHRRNADILREYQVLCGDLEQKVEDLEAWIASPPPVPTSKPAFAPDEDGIW